MRLLPRAFLIAAAGAVCALLTCPIAVATTGPAAARGPQEARAAALAAIRGLQAAPASPASLATRELHVVRGEGTTSPAESYNWSGYVEFPPGRKTMAQVSGDWTEPKISCTSDEDEEAVFWVGLDGWTNDTVEQDGTFAECYEHVAYYYDWWEMYPTNDIITVSAINPGDKIISSVKFSAGTYTLTVTDSTDTAADFTESETCGTGLTCENSSAEWIGETPGNVRGYYPLPDFKTWKVTKAAAGTSLSSAGSISKEDNLQVTMTSDAGYALATPGALNTKGNSFVDTWDNSY
jgi:hypothetical protein